MLTSHSSRPITERPEAAVSGAHPEPSPWLWLIGGALLFFMVPFVGTDVLGLQPDLYYLCYFTVAVLWFAAFVATYRAGLHDLWRRNLAWSLAVGALAGAAVVAVVLGQAATDHPDGWRWWFEIGWRGVVYGSIDALILFVFPAAVAHLLMHGNRHGAGRTVGFAALALALSVLMSTCYHLGYPTYRDADLRSPLIGTVMANSATILTGNPVGALVTHVPAHITAVVHQEEGGPTHMLPPEVDQQYADRGDSDIVPWLAGLWMLAVAGAGIVLVRRRPA